MTSRTAAITFPSIQFFQALAYRMNTAEVKYRAIGFMDLEMGIRVLADGPVKQPRLFTLTFEGYGCEKVREAGAGEQPDMDFVLEGRYSAWKEMFENIQRNGKADTKHTLNHLTMLDDPLRAVGPDQSRIDKLYRFNYSLQMFLDEAVGVPTKYG